MPVREAGDCLRWTVTSGPGGTALAGKALPPASLRRLPDGTLLMPVRDLLTLGAGIDRDPDSGSIRIYTDQRSAMVPAGKKRVEISLERQELRAWQGDRLLLKTACSTGKPGFPTPPGEFYATDRQRMAISQKYGNAEMPWCVQVYGDITIHGSKSVPPRAASHGCIRLPLTGVNPAKWFFEWVEIGTPIIIRR